MAFSSSIMLDNFGLHSRHEALSKFQFGISGTLSKFVTCRFYILLLCHVINQLKGEDYLQSIIQGWAGFDNWFTHVRDSGNSINKY